MSIAVTVWLSGRRFAVGERWSALYTAASSSYREVEDQCLTMKWSNRIAQGFSQASALGYGISGCALKVAPEETPLRIGTLIHMPKHPVCFQRTFHYQLTQG
jgi:hypothetical protein